ncbi:MAG: carboxypeptidase-like regulatory domain-containing protein [Candidatus Latescibacter sp.]|nr:carboxypeptidase-like regulatory domain-containing protein [Candidatus Latescibacter sp.]
MKKFVLLPILLSAVIVIVCMSCSGKTVSVLDTSAANTSNSNAALSGRVVDKWGKGMQGITITVGEASTLTDSLGQYAVDKINTGSYTITPTKKGDFFLPVSRAISITPTPLPIKDFIGSTEDLGNTGHNGDRGYCAQCHSI